MTTCKKIKNLSSSSWGTIKCVSFSHQYKSLSILKEITPVINLVLDYLTKLHSTTLNCIRYTLLFDLVTKFTL